MATNLKRSIQNALRVGNERHDWQAFRDAFDMCRALEMQNATSIASTKNRPDEVLYDQENYRQAHRYVSLIKATSTRLLKDTGDSMLADIVHDCLLFDAPHDFDSAIQYAEWDRPQEKKFYLPRRKQLLPVVNALQRLEEGELDLLCISEPPGIGKTTVAIMFLIWSGMRNPDKQILGGSHSNSFLRGVYDEINRMLDPTGEYLWREIFPSIQVTGKNAKDMRIDLNTKKRFETFEFSSIGSGNAGKVRATNLLYCDDLVSGIEEALSRDRMDKLWQQYYTDLRQRKQGDCKELHIATRWSLYDPIGRLEQSYGEDPRAEFIRFAALDEDDKSNFDYPYGLGFTTEFYHEQREIMDEASFRALYLNEPIEREGQLYAMDELQRYFELPDRDPDAIICVCDTKTTGSDDCVLPVAYQYGDMFYIEDILCENYAPDVVEVSLENIIVKHDPHFARFESNVAGGKLAQIIQERIKARGCRTKVTSKWTQANKETKIQVNAPWVKQHCLFRDDSVLQGGEWKEYRSALTKLCGYTLGGRNKHDDVPDAFAQLAEFAQTFSKRQVRLVDRFF